MFLKERISAYFSGVVGMTQINSLWGLITATTTTTVNVASPTPDDVRRSAAAGARAALSAAQRFP